MVKLLGNVEMLYNLCDISVWCTQQKLSELKKKGISVINEALYTAFFVDSIIDHLMIDHLMIDH